MSINPFQFWRMLNLKYIQKKTVYTKYTYNRRTQLSSLWTQYLQNTMTEITNSKPPKTPDTRTMIARYGGRPVGDPPPTPGPVDAADCNEWYGACCKLDDQLPFSVLSFSTAKSVRHRIKVSGDGFLYGALERRSDENENHEGKWRQLLQHTLSRQHAAWRGCCHCMQSRKCSEVLVSYGYRLSRYNDSKLWLLLTRGKDWKLRSIGMWKQLTSFLVCFFMRHII